MKSRLKIELVQPEATRGLLRLEQFLAQSAIPVLQKELIKIRASQINGCGYCVNMHTRDARKHGETEQRMALICVWREAGDIFTEEEQLLLAITEEITLIHRGGLSDTLYDRAVASFGEEKTAQIIMAIITINAWNRLAVSLHKPLEA